MTLIHTPSKHKPEGWGDTLCIIETPRRFEIYKIFFLPTKKKDHSVWHLMPLKLYLNRWFRNNSDIITNRTTYGWLGHGSWNQSAIEMYACIKSYEKTDPRKFSNSVRFSQFNQCASQQHTFLWFNWILRPIAFSFRGSLTGWCTAMYF